MRARSRPVTATLPGMTLAALILCPPTDRAAVLLDEAGILRAGPGEVGGKAWHLARLRRYGFRTPLLLAVPAQVHRDWLRAAPVTRADLLRVWAANAPLPAGLAAALRGLAARADCWAVRSSAPHEDHAAHASAGQYVTRLNVPAADLPQAVRAVWASLWAEHAVTYRASAMDTAPSAPEMAVLLTPMVDAVSSGVAFTADPVTHAPEVLSIHAAWGLGERVVQGEAADRFTFRSDPLRSRLDPAGVQIMYKAAEVRARTGGGVGLAETPAARAGQATLTPAQAHTLAHLIRQAALSLEFSAAHDLEWAFDGQHFWILQARPLTGRSDGPVTWTRGNIGEVTPRPLRAVDWSAAQVIMPQVLTGALRAAGLPGESGAPRCALRGGYLYLEASGLQRDLRRAFGLTAADVNALLGGAQPAPVDPAPTPAERRTHALHLLRLGVRLPLLRLLGRAQATRLIRWSARQAAAPLPLTDEALSAALSATFDELLRQRALFLLQGAGAAAWALRRLLTRLDPAGGAALALDLLRGGRPSVSAAQARDLARLARLARRDPAAQAWLRAGPTWPPPLPGRHPLRRGLDRFLRRYGHRAAGESYTAPPRWRDDPRPLLTHLALLAARPTPAPRRARRPVRVTLWWPGVALLAALARQELRDRELGRSAVFSPAGAYRRLLLRAGATWAEQGHLTQADDVFDLTLPELHAALRGERPLRGLRQLTRDRQAALARQEAARPPEVILEGRTGPVAPPVQAPAAAGAPTWRGTCASRGAVSGRACVVRHPADHAHLQPGDILIAVSTDPAWAPLYLQAGGLVVERGGLLSHGAIIAREFGLPTLIGVPGLLETVRTGDRLHLDATNGTLTRTAWSGT